MVLRLDLTAIGQPPPRRGALSLGSRRAGFHVAVMEPFADVTEPAIAALVARFYAKARVDPLIGPVFNDAVEDWDEHLRTLNAFWSSVMLTAGATREIRWRRI